MDKLMLPQISVIMGIFNCEKTLSEAIESIVNQTVSDWELIMCDDASTDGTYAEAQRFKEKYPNKIILLKNDCNHGLNYTLNRCLQFAKGKYIARMDGDDICASERFAIEMEVLDNEQEIAIVSSDMSFFDESGVWGSIAHPEYPEKEIFYMDHLFVMLRVWLERKRMIG